MKAWQKTLLAFITTVAVIGPAWTGMINSFNTNGVESAHARAVKADTKADLGFELLSQKVALESKQTSERLDRVEKQLDKLDTKMDSLLLGSSSSHRRNSHVSAGRGGTADKIAAPKKSADLPPNLELAYQQHQKKK